MYKMTIIAAAFLLTACDATIEDQQSDIAAIQQQLPDGCVIHYAGQVAIEGSQYKSRIFYTTCGDTTTVSENHVVKQGKSSHNESNVVISSRK